MAVTGCEPQGAHGAHGARRTLVDTRTTHTRTRDSWMDDGRTPHPQVYDYKEIDALFDELDEYREGSIELSSLKPALRKLERAAALQVSGE